MASVRSPASCAKAKIAGTNGATASRSSVAIVRDRWRWNDCVPCRSPPTRNAQAEHQQQCWPRIEPISAVCTTTTRPACSAKNEMNSSGMLPKVAIEDARRSRTGSADRARRWRALPDQQSEARQPLTR